MADNVPITAGAGTNIATDDVGSVHFQKVKLDAGGDGASVPVVAGQQLMAASLPVVVASNQSAVPGSVADGSDVALGATADAAVETDTTGTVSGKLRGLVKLMVNLLSRWPAALGTGGGLKVDGSGTALPVSAAALPLPSGAATSALQGGGLPAALGTGGGLKIDGSGTALPVVGLEDVLSVTLTTDTSAYASGDVLADSQEVASAFRANGTHLTITSIVIQDQSDTGMGFDLVFLDANNSLGTENSAPNISDANATAILGIVPVGQSDWIDLGGCRIATLLNMSLGPIEAAAGSTSLWIGAISRGSGTYAADALRLKISIVRD